MVVNLCESFAGAARGEMFLPVVLDALGVPYTGSDALALGLALSKDKAKSILLANGVPTPQGAVVTVVADVDAPACKTLKPPLIVKPCGEDASIGISFDSVAFTHEALRNCVAVTLRTHGEPLLVEEYVTGRELAVPLIDGVPDSLPVNEVSFGSSFEGKPHIVTYRAKWVPTSSEYRDSSSGRAALAHAVEQRVRDVAVQAFASIGARGYGRVDIRLADDGTPFVIDINPNCDLSPDAGFARSAAAAGISYGDLLGMIVTTASRHHPQAAR